MVLLSGPRYSVWMGDIFDVIADSNRRELLRVLLEALFEGGEAPGEVSVSGLVDALGLTQPTVSKHLKVLRDIGLVEVREEGQHRFYRLEASPLEELESWLIPFMGLGLVGSDSDDDADAGATVFSAWAGSGIPKPFRRVAETLDHPAEAGAAVGRSAARATHQVRSVIEGATQAIGGVTSKVEKKVIDPIREKLTRKGNRTP